MTVTIDMAGQSNSIMDALLRAVNYPMQPTWFYMGETTMKILRVGPVEYHRRASRRKRHARYRRGKTGVRPRKRDR